MTKTDILVEHLRRCKDTIARLLVENNLEDRDALVVMDEAIEVLEVA